MALFNFKVIAISKVYPELTFDCNSYFELDQAEAARDAEAKAYTTCDGSSNWEFVVQRIGYASFI